MGVGTGPGPRPILIHTFHGHSLTGYFSPRTASIYRRIERSLAGHTDALIAVSGEVRDELVELGVADADRFEVVPLGFDLAPFGVGADEQARRRHRFRTELGIPADNHVVTLIARLVPIKRVDRFLRVARSLAEQRQDVHFLVVGDGELRERSKRARRRPVERSSHLGGLPSRHPGCLLCQRRSRADLGQRRNPGEPDRGPGGGYAGCRRPGRRRGQRREGRHQRLRCRTRR